MRFIMDLHTHTVHSHGKGTVFENARAAHFEGLRILGICEHGPRHAFYPIKKYELLKFETDYASRDGLVVLPGLEANLLSAEGDTDFTSGYLRFFGFHRGVWPKNKKAVYFMARGNITPRSMRAMMTDAIIRAIETHDMDALTHPGRYVPIDIRAVAQAAAKRGTVLEINETSPLSLKEIEIAAGEGARFIASSDAHRISAVGQLETAAFLLKQAGAGHLTLNAEGYAFDVPLHLNRLQEFLK